MKIAALLLFVISVSIVPCWACSFESVTASDCGREPRALSVAREQLAPWFRDVQQRIKLNPDYEIVKARLLKYPHQKVSIGLYVEMRASGNVVDVKVLGAVDRGIAYGVGTSGVDEIDRRLLELIRTSAPFKTPPNSLVCRSQRGMSLFFERDGHSLTVSAHLGRSIPIGSSPIKQFLSYEPRQYKAFSDRISCRALVDLVSDRYERSLRVKSLDEIDIGLGEIVDGKRKPIFLCRDEIGSFLRNEQQKNLLVVWVDEGVAAKGDSISSLRRFCDDLGFPHVLALTKEEFGIHVHFDLWNDEPIFPASIVDDGIVLRTRHINLADCDGGQIDIGIGQQDVPPDGCSNERFVDYVKQHPVWLPRSFKLAEVEHFLRNDCQNDVLYVSHSKRSLSEEMESFFYGLGYKQVVIKREFNMFQQPPEIVSPH